MSWNQFGQPRPITKIASSSDRMERWFELWSVPVRSIETTRPADMHRLDRRVASSDRAPDRTFCTRVRRRLVAAIGHALIRWSGARIAGEGVVPLHGIHRILICRPNHRLGNILLLTPLLAELERVYPGAEVDLVVGSSVGEELLLRFPHVRNVMNLTSRIARHPMLLVSVLRKIRAAHYDLAIDPVRGSTSGRLLTLAARARFSIGVCDDVTAGPAAVAPARQHFARLPVDALRGAIRSREMPIDEETCPPLSIRLSLDEKEAGRHALAALARTTGAEPVIGVFGNATGRKRLAPASWQEMIEHLRHLRPDLVVVEVLAAHGSSELGCRYPTFYSTNPRYLAAFTSQLTCLISADCGVMHLAAASGVATIGLFSVTDPSRYRPYGSGSRSIVTVGKSTNWIAAACADAIDEISSATPGRAANEGNNHSSFRF